MEYGYLLNTLDTVKLRRWILFRFVPEGEDFTLFDEYDVVFVAENDERLSRKVVISLANQHNCDPRQIYIGAGTYTQLEKGSRPELFWGDLGCFRLFGYDRPRDSEIQFEMLDAFHDLIFFFRGDHGSKD